jgi:hypothetical protein
LFDRQSLKSHDVSHTGLRTLTKCCRPHFTNLVLSLPDMFCSNARPWTPLVTSKTTPPIATHTAAAGAPIPVPGPGPGAAPTERGWYV